MTERRLNGVAALIAAQNTQLKVGVDEKHTAFVKRIVNAYLDALETIEAEPAPAPRMPMKSED